MSRFLEECKSFIESNGLEFIRVSEIHNGGEPETVDFMDINPCVNAYSVAKTFTMTAIGLLYDKGLVKPEDKVCDILSDEIPEGMDERWCDSTVDMALTHRLGLPGGFLDIDVHPSTEFTDDFLKYMLTYPLAFEPGEQRIYSDGAFYLLARIAEKKAGMCLDNFLWQELLVKLGFKEMAWSHCPKGHAMGATGLYIHSSDMVKLGQLYLTGGLYNGERLLSEKWVKMAVEREYALDWDEEHRIYYKGGMCGQKLIIAPEQNRVVAVQAFHGNSGAVADWMKNYKD